MKLPILIDCDGVLSDFDRAIQELAARAGVYTTEDDMSSWNWLDGHWPTWRAAVGAAVEEREFCFRLQAYPGATSWLRSVEKEFGAERVFICTTPWSAAWLGQRAAWLEQRGVPMKRQIQCSAKGLIPGHLIDDRPTTVEPRAAGHGFCLARPWNRSVAALRGDYAAAVAWLRDVAQ